MNFISCLRIGGSRRSAIVASSTPGLGLDAQSLGNAHVNRLRQRDLEKHVAIVLILLWVLPVSMTLRADENRVEEKLADEKRQSVASINERGQNTSLLDGKRLFFNHEQRRGSMSNAEILPGSLSSEELSKGAPTGSGPIAVVEPRTSIVIAEPVARTERIHYHARIEGWEVIRVIVNGLPCEAVNRADLARGASGIALTCNSMIAKRLQLMLLADGASIQIMDGKRVKGIITPGGSL